MNMTEKLTYLGIFCGGRASSCPSLSLDGSEKSEFGNSLKSLAVEMLISITDAFGEPSSLPWVTDPFGLDGEAFISKSIKK